MLGLDESGVRTIVERHRREPTYRPITIIQDASLAQVAAVTAHRLDFELPDVVVEPTPTRRYPEKMGAHLFGYVGEVSDSQVADDSSLRSGDITGQSGIEKVYNMAREQAPGATANVQIALPASNQELAAHIGTVRELVSRNISRLQAEGLIEVDGRTVTIPKLAVLRNQLETGE